MARFSPAGTRHAGYGDRSASHVLSSLTGPVRGGRGLPVSPLLRSGRPAARPDFHALTRRWKVRSLLSGYRPGYRRCSILKRTVALRVLSRSRRGSISPAQTSVKASGWVRQYLRGLGSSPRSMRRPDRSEMPAMAAAVFWVLPAFLASLYTLICTWLIGLPDTGNLHGSTAIRMPTLFNGLANCQRPAPVTDGNRTR